MNIYLRKVASEGINHHVEHCIFVPASRVLFSSRCPTFRVSLLSSERLPEDPSSGAPTTGLQNRAVLCHKTVKHVVLSILLSRIGVTETTQDQRLRPPPAIAKSGAPSERRLRGAATRARAPIAAESRCVCVCVFLLRQCLYTQHISSDGFMNVKQRRSLAQPVCARDPLLGFRSMEKYDSFWEFWLIGPGGVRVEWFTGGTEGFCRLKCFMLTSGCSGSYSRAMNAKMNQNELLDWPLRQTFCG